MRSQPRERPEHPAEVRRVHQRLLDRAGLTSSTVHTADGVAVHLVEQGAGPPVVLIHGSGSPALFWLPLLQRLDGVHALAVDRPGFGLSDGVTADRSQRDPAVGWVGRLLDALGLPSAILVGHSMGGLWSLRFALAQPDRVTGLVLIGTPGLPGTRAPLPFRLMGTPGVGAVIARQRETPQSVRRFARMVGEGSTIPQHPHLVELLVAVGNDPVAGTALRAEVGALLSPWALATRTGFRAGARITESDLRGLDVPTLLINGDRDPVGGTDVAQRIHDLIPHAELEVVPGGHAPWLGHSTRIGATMLEWIQRTSV